MLDSPLHAFLDLTTVGLGDSAAARILDSLESAMDMNLLNRVVVLSDWAAHPSLESDSRVRWAQSGAPVAIADEALRSAARAGADLLVLLGVQVPSPETISRMKVALDEDPYFGFALARSASSESDEVLVMDERYALSQVGRIPRAVLARMDAVDLIDDVLLNGFLVDQVVVRDFESLDSSLKTVWGAFRELMARARRVGFRTVLVHDAIITVESLTLPREPESREEEILSDRYPEIRDYARDWWRWGRHVKEGLLTLRSAADPSCSKTMLLDLRDLGALYNGTSEAVLGLLSGLKALKSDWTIRLWVSPEASQFHDLDRRFPEFLQVWPGPVEKSVVVFRPIQPWSLQHLESLHSYGLFVFVMMFDTIISESRIGAPAEIDRVWGALARVADGLFYISKFTRDRFRRRFTVADNVTEAVIYLATHPEEYVSGEESTEGDYLFVVGNHLPHKWLGPTIRDLSIAFPYLPIRALGFEDASIRMLAGLPSGSATEEEVDRLYRDAKLIVYPSQYEGFGIPIIRGLAKAKTVVARETSLLHELADQYRGPGNLQEYSSSSELVERVAEVLHGIPREGMRFGRGLESDECPRRHVDVAREVMEMIENRLARPEESNWDRRQAMFEFANAYRLTGFF